MPQGLAPLSFLLSFYSSLLCGSSRVYLMFCFKTGLPAYPRLAPNSPFPCIGFPSPGTIGVDHHTQGLIIFFLSPFLGQEAPIKEIAWFTFASPLP